MRHKVNLANSQVKQAQLQVNFEVNDRQLVDLVIRGRNKTFLGACGMLVLNCALKFKLFVKCLRILVEIHSDKEGRKEMFYLMEGRNYFI